MAKILTIQVGLPKTMQYANPQDGRSESWRSAIYKEGVSGPVWAGRTDLVGDGQADLRVHGGEDKAVYAYPAEHYPLWRAELGLPEMAFGAFGENLTVEGLLEDEVCIGDVFQAGEARLQVSQPRGPCWKLTRRWNVRGLEKRFSETGRTGFYLRVLQEGYIMVGTALERIERPAPEWSVLRAHRLLEKASDDLEAAAALSELPWLSQSCRRDLKKHFPNR
jgi:MOSC domain-containing protein YiiM